MNKQRLHLLFTLIFLGTVLLSSLFIVSMIRGNGISIESNILNLLPQGNTPEQFQDKVDQFSSLMERKVVFILSDSSQTGDSLWEYAAKIETKLQTSSLFSEISGTQSDTFFEEYSTLFFPHRSSLLTESTIDKLKNRQYDEFNELLLDRLYNPFSAISGTLIKSDPLFLSLSYLESQQKSNSTFSIKNGFLTAKDSIGSHILITATLDTLKSAKNAVLLENEITQLIKSVENSEKYSLVWNGVLRYSSFAEQEAKFEITLFGTLSTVAIIILLLLAFRSPAPLLWGVIPVFIGIIFAISGTVFLFGNLNVLTLIFGTTLVGVSVDYGFHYLSALYWGTGDTTKRFTVMNHIFHGTILGMISSVAGYAVLILAPFKGLQQMATFASLGLVGAFFTVILLFPYLPWRVKEQKELRLFNVIQNYVNLPFFQKRSTHLILILALFIFTVVSFTVKSDDDIRLLKGDAPHLTEIEKRLESLGLNTDKSRVVVVKGNSENELLEMESLVINELKKLTKSGQLDEYFAINTLIPSQAQQKQNRKFISEYLQSPQAEEYFTLLGTTKKDVSSSYDTKDTSSLGYQTILSSQLFAPYHSLCPDSMSESNRFSLIMLKGINNGAAIENVLEPLPFAFYVDRVGKISGLFKQFRQVAAKMIAVAYLLIFIALAVRYSVGQAYKIMLPSLIATVALLSGMAFFGIAVNIFTLMAILLVLAIGLDYTLFFTESKGDYGATSNAIILSSITTTLSFGLLGLSSTPALSILGGTLFWGVVIVVLLSPLAVRKGDL